MTVSQEKILDTLFKSEMFEKMIGDTPLKIRQLPLKEKNDSISGRVSFQQQSIFKLALEFKDRTDAIYIMKLKSEQIIKNGIELMNYDSSDEFQKIMDGPHSILGYDNSHIREGYLYTNISDSLKGTLPEVFGSFHDTENDIYAILMSEYENELPFDEHATLMSLDAITDYHAYYYNRRAAVSELLLNEHTTSDYKEQKVIFFGMLQKLEKDNKAIFSEHHLKLIKDFALHIDEYHMKLPEHRSLTHNDFTPRNIFCCKNGVILYDWELACYQCPEHDLIEFVLFIMTELSDEQILSIIDTFKQMLFKKCNIFFDDKTYNSILRFNLLEYCVNRLNLYRVCNKGLQVKFIDGLALNAERLLTILNIDEENYE